MDLPAVHFDQEVSFVINSLIRFAAPSFEVLREIDPNFFFNNEDDDKIEEKTLAQSTILSPMGLESKRDEVKKLNLAIRQELEDSPVAVHDDLPNLIGLESKQEELEENYFAIGQRLDEGMRLAQAEKDEFKNFYDEVKRLKDLILKNYQDALEHKNRVNQRYLINFMAEFKKTIAIVKNKKLSLPIKNTALTRLAFIASPSSTISKTIAPIAAPASGLVGGLAGLLLGGLVGGVAGLALGFLGGIGCILAGIYSGTALGVRPEEVVALVTTSTVLGAVAGLVGGMIKGAMMGWRNGHAYTSEMLYNTTALSKKVEQVAKSQTVKSALGRQVIENKIGQYTPALFSQRLGPTSIIGDYLSSVDKDRAAFGLKM